MRKIATTSLMMIAALCFTFTAVNAQKKPTTVNSTKAKVAKKKQTVKLNAVSTPSDEFSTLERPVNDKNHPAEKSRGDVYGDDYSDIIFDNWTGLYMDVYVDGTYRGSLAPWATKTTWAIPGKTKMVAKATYSDGSYSTWSLTVKTGYEYTLELHD